MLGKMINKNILAGKSNRRLLGKILVDGGFITAQNLEAALTRQKETNEQLGEALVGMGALNPLDLNVVLSVQRNTLKAWLPHIKILQPDKLKDIFLNDMKTWISWQETS